MNILSTVISRRISTGISRYTHPLFYALLFYTSLLYRPLPVYTTSYFALTIFRFNALSLVYFYLSFCLMGISFLVYAHVFRNVSRT
jgi:hypothetical protein